MLQLRKSEQRGQGHYGWLHARYTFSFAQYYDPEFVGFRDLLVINQDTIAPGRGFDTHSHRDMEIITYVIDGALSHRDSMGNEDVIHSNEIQRMTAGSGISHSEFNHSKEEPVNLLQIWIRPKQLGLAPSYQQLNYQDGESQSALQLLAGPEHGEGVALVHQDCFIYLARSKKNQSITLPLASIRYGWIQMIKGEIHVQDLTLKEGDGLAISQLQDVEVRPFKDSIFLFFNLA